MEDARAALGRETSKVLRMEAEAAEVRWYAECTLPLPTLLLQHSSRSHLNLHCPARNVRANQHIERTNIKLVLVTILYDI